MALLRTASRLSLLLLALLLTSPLLLPVAVLGQDAAKLPFLAEHYDVSATLDPASQSLSGVAKVDFRASETSATDTVPL